MLLPSASVTTQSEFSFFFYFLYIIRLQMPSLMLVPKGLAFLQSGKFCAVNNTCEPQSAAVYTDGGSLRLDTAANEILRCEI